MSETEVDRVVDELEREFRGDPWHGSPLGDILRGVTAAQASSRPLPAAHSIWELVLHMTAWKNEVTRRLSGLPAGEPQEGDWPSVGATTPERWTAALADLERSHHALLDAVRTLSEERLLEPTKDFRDRATGTGVSHYVLLHGIVQHDVYHAGQIAMLRKGSAGFR